ncbi:MAG: CPBP family intramembrane metalloprotease [Verrucomicrobiae bacterium]|nr:CPBP family intramembrane metalloprotease [Verrucomicrobiae bacterium]
MVALLFASGLCAGEVVSGVAPGEVAEPDLMAQWPLAGLVLQLLGLCADGYLLARWRRCRGVGSKPWGLSVLAVAVGISTAVFLSVGMAGMVLRLQPPAMLLTLATAELLLGGIFLFCLRLERVSWCDAFGLREVPVVRAALQGAIFFVAVQPPLFALGTLRDWLYRVLGWKLTVQDLVGKLMTTDSLALILVVSGFAVVVAPLCEEVFFRGLAYPALKQRLGAPLAMTVVSVLFAVIHFHAPSVPLLLLLAFGLTLAYEYSGSLVAPVTMHALFNLLNLVAILLYRAQA